MIKVIYLTALGDYRLGVVQQLLQSDSNIKIYAGEEAFDPSIKVLRSETNLFYPLKNKYLWKRRFLLQIGSALDAIRADVLILDLNPRVINVWFFLLIRKILAKRTILWGHAWSRIGGSGVLLRKLISRLASGLIVYTETQRQEALEANLNRLIWAAPNSLYREKDILMQSNSGFPRNNFIYVGRLVEDKKPELMIRAFSKFKENVTSSCSLSVVGAGPQMPYLKNLVRELNLSADVNFFGHISGMDELRVHYERAIASISPGYVGLSITQSLAFGVPMIIAREENHAPEIEAARENFNSMFFKSDSIEDLSRVIEEFYRDRLRWNDSNRLIREDCSVRYSVEAMAQGILEALH
ncbi:glycosyltransferase [Curvibacter lanceolatus]|uniref:glycosyltransferase n=1 Tax=Curvibacter lanceolatus TaxID=86182 RepID=UPI0005BB80D3|nr:glycosyltransferase [Curvibacter lanceolatus]